jgi:hypothetical protein
MPDAEVQNQGVNDAAQQVDKPSTEGDASVAPEPKPSPSPTPGVRPARRRRLLIGAAGVVVMVVALGFGIPRIELESRSLGLPHLIAIVIAVFTTMALLLAVLDGIEAAFWAAAYLWLGASTRLKRRSSTPSTRWSREALRD